MPIASDLRTTDWGFGRRLATAVAVTALLVAITLLDEATGLFHLTVLYAIPIIAATWAFGLPGGLVAGAISIGAVSFTHSLIHSPTLIADIITDVVVFLVAVVVVDRLRHQLRTIRSLEARRDLDLGIARDIQTRMLGAPVPDERFEVASTVHFAREVGGDDFRFAETGHALYLFAGDISGKGMSAALFAVLLDEAIRDASVGSDTLDALVNTVNRRMYGTMPPDMFVTMLFAAMDDWGVTFVNAGHVRPLLLGSATGGVVELAEAATLPLGIEPSIETHPTTIAFARGDMLLVCSDGVTESPALLSEPTLLHSTFNETAARGPRAVVDAVIALSESRGQTDDITVICIRRR